MTNVRPTPSLWLSPINLDASNVSVWESLLLALLLTGSETRFVPKLKQI